MPEQPSPGLGSLTAMVQDQRYLDKLTLASRIHAAKGPPQLLSLDSPCRGQLSTPLKHQEKGGGGLSASS